ncbi:uncharacterized protein LOC109847669 [Asparagus officinalis]|uniref:uncharacterized protein LOC109847669 n=1 Tax=Asparagus officinalis TaxID=4686 RepID=UPI00098DF641|nr:uncharacterized protein LOC109847669 [Asparagus officinalis]
MEALRNIENQQSTYGCKRCGEKFSSGRALGGHQKKHRVEDQDAAGARVAFSTRNGQPVLINSSQQQIQQEDFENLHQEGPNGICLFCLKRAPLKLHFNHSRILASAIKKARKGKLGVKRGGSPPAERSLNIMANASSSTISAGTKKKRAVSVVEAESGGKKEYLYFFIDLWNKRVLLVYEHELPIQ